jgi:hypothetical protein
MARMDLRIDGIPKAVEKDLPAAKTELRKAIGRAVGQIVDRALPEMQRMIGTQGPSAPGQPPGRQSGDYRGSWDKGMHPSGLGGYIFTPSPLAHLLEDGTARMGARPHAGPLGERMKNPYVSAMKSEVSKL